MFLSLTPSVVVLVVLVETAGECEGGDQHAGPIPHTQGDLVLGGSSLPTWPQAATPL